MLMIFPTSRSKVCVKRSSQKSELPLFYDTPTTEAVGSNFVTSIEPTALVVGAEIINPIRLTKY
jgi:hypothetical protein